MLKICALWALLAPAVAQVYKWVDDKGVTHYGERAPQGRKADEVQQRLANPGSSPGGAAQPSWKEQDLAFRKRRIEAEQAEVKEKQREAAQREACNRGRDQLAQLRGARRVYRMDEKGERVFQTDEERKASIERLEQLVSERCR